LTCRSVAEGRTRWWLCSKRIGPCVGFGLCGIPTTAAGLNVGDRADVKVDLSITRTERYAIGSAGFRFVDNASAIGASLALVGVDRVLL
jgi:hypothetical protein